MQISYSSSDTSILDNYGKIGKNADGTVKGGVVTLTVTVTYNGVSDDASYVVHVLNSDADYAIM